SDWPVTSGTETGAGPLETSTSTPLPSCSTVPAGGFVPITFPAATVVLACLVTRGLKPALRSFFSASASLSPSTSVTGALAGPPDTTRFTREPRSTRLLASGDWLITTPVGTVELDCSCGTGFSPARRRIASAVCSLCPVTSGTLTLPAPPPSSSTRTATMASAASVPPTHHNQRRLDGSPSSGGRSSS